MWFKLFVLWLFTVFSNLILVWQYSTFIKVIAKNKLIKLGSVNCNTNSFYFYFSILFTLHGYFKLKLKFQFLRTRKRFIPFTLLYIMMLLLTWGKFYTFYYRKLSQTLMSLRFWKIWIKLKIIYTYITVRISNLNGLKC